MFNVSLCLQMMILSGCLYQTLAELLQNFISWTIRHHWRKTCGTGQINNQTRQEHWIKKRAPIYTLKPANCGTHNAKQKIFSSYVRYHRQSPLVSRTKCATRAASYPNTKQTATLSENVFFKSVSDASI